MRRSLTVLAASAAVLVAASPAATAAPVDDDPPSVTQLCLATGLDEVDALLDGVARTSLVDALAPLATLTVPDRDTVELDASVQLTQLRQALNCDQVVPVIPPPTTTRPPTPTTAAAPPASSGFSQLDRVPTRAAETGGGPAE